MTRELPYGTWPSPIGADAVARHGGAVSSVQRHGAATWWTQAQPADGGRVTVRRLDDGAAAPVEALPAPWNARNRHHEYGATPYTVVDGALVFTAWSDQRIHVVDGETVRPLTPSPEREHGLRYALGPAAGAGEVWAVRETVIGERPTDIRRDLVAVPLDGSGPRPLGPASHHFLTVPVPSPDGRHAAWIGWDHPSMPWDGTQLCVAEITGDGFGPHRVVAGGPDEAVVQVVWDGQGLLALTDPGGWWNLHRVPLDGDAPRNLAPVERDLGDAMWKVGAQWCAPLGRGRHGVLAAGQLCLLDEQTGTVTDVALAEEVVEWSSTLAVDGDLVHGVAGSATRSDAVVRVDLGTGAVDWLTSAAELPDPAWLPRPEHRTVAGVPVVWFPPTSPECTGPAGAAPPLLVHVHGGPTSRNVALPDLDIAYFTSRGFAVVAPDYGGSTGHGRAWRNRLREQWGVVDVDDCAAVALELAEQGQADRDRLVVRGGSAGGWTTAASLAALPPDGGRPVYACGTSRYPILDLLGWATGETHDFESQYLTSLVGPLPETEQRYRERSPSSHPRRLTAPILLLQGLDDRICPSVQADRFVAELAGSGIPHAYLAFEGEQHGFRRAETIIATLTAELGFYADVLGLAVPGAEPPELRT
ncbi:prolyl oligopeptidase family serine peptidase [Pseudonocardia sp. CA-107938]|uniref:prolyl oligopeptidase family serine peptidase n=1 Tax=Pseudonocardia sp. CA-107938 TaxID=3240021 RepID=UPI003D94D097